MHTYIQTDRQTARHNKYINIFGGYLIHNHTYTHTCIVICIFSICAAASFVSTGKSDGRCRGTQLFEVIVPLAQCAAKCAETPSCRYFGSWSAGYNGAGKDGCRGWDACEGSLEPLWSGYYNRIYRMTGPIHTTAATTTTTTIAGS